MGEAKRHGTKEQRVANAKSKYTCGTCFQKLPVNAEGKTVCGMRRSKDLKWIPICESCLNPKPKPTECSFSLKLDKLTSINEPEEYSAGLIGWVIGAGGTLLLFGLATFIYMMCGVYFSN